MVDFIPRHRAQPGVSLTAHLASRMQELADLVLPRTRVYLDTKYWILLRDAAMGRPRDDSHRELLENLTDWTARGSHLCPIGESVFFELIRQSDWETRRATAKLIDTLSLGATIQNVHDRVQTELRHFLTATSMQRKVPGPPLAFVWLKVGHVLGSPYPNLPDLDSAEELVLQKAFLDVMWSLTLEELLTDTEVDEASSVFEFQDLAVQLTSESQAHEVELSSFDAVFQSEIAGFFDACGGDIQAVFLQLYRESKPQGAMPSSEELAEKRTELATVFANVFRHGKPGTSLPTAEISAGIHAYIRWQRQRGFQTTDFFDLNHASAALPYCDFFLTERFLGTALTRPPLSFDDHYGCKVLWREREALEALQQSAS